MKAKSEVVKSLKNVKLVIGNGFDLYCHLKTSYSDYFRYDNGKNNYFKDWIDKFWNRAWWYVDVNDENHREYWIDFDNWDIVNVWDFFFFLVSQEKDVDITKWRWCDIESKIEESLSDPLGSKDCYKWSLVFNLLFQKKGADYYSLETCILASVVYRKNCEKIFSSKNEFYEFLLQQLKLFEKNFGRYIYHQHVNDTMRNSGYITENSLFKADSRSTIERLCDPKNLVSIDSFNYDSVDIPELEHIFHNINGDIDAPIFGIDSSKFRVDDPRNIFSKTNRRMELDMMKDHTFEPDIFDNLIIFGHSLNPADYSYFFSVFDKIEITNLGKDTKIIFAFSIYDENRREQIKSGLRKAVFRLFHDYSIYKGNETFANRLLDALTTQGKVLMFEIPYIEVNPKPDYFCKL